MNAIQIMATVMPMLYVTIQMELTVAMFVMLDMDQMMLEVNAKISMNAIQTMAGVMPMLHVPMKQDHSAANVMMVSLVMELLV